MKSIRLALCSLAIATCISAYAQENNNRDSEGKVVRGPYETNAFGDNWFIGVQGGVNLFFDNKEGYEFSDATPSLDINVGKWFTPCVGARFGYQGIIASQKADKVVGSSTAAYLQEFSFAYFHGDVLWNISNTIGGYKETRFWNFSPYIHGGYLRLYDIKDDSNDHKWKDTNPYDNEWAMGFGLLNTLRIHKCVNVTLDLRQMLFSARFHNYDDGGKVFGLSALAGLSFNIGKTNWKRVSSSAATLAATQLALANAESALAVAQEQVNALKNAPKEVVEVIKEVPAKGDGDTRLVPLALGVPPITLYYEINSTELNVTERQHLTFYVENILEQDPDRKFLLTGRADAGTGSKDINERLSKGRVENVIKILTEEFGISKDRLIIQGTKVTDEAPDPRLDRSVIIVH